ncbi:hypothetical protein Bca101_016215 [Brassica carinata]
MVIASTKNAASDLPKVKSIAVEILKDKNLKPGIKLPLRDCVEFYDDANDSLNDTLRFVNLGEYKSAVSALSTALDVPIILVFELALTESGSGLAPIRLVSWVVVVMEDDGSASSSSSSSRDLDAQNPYDRLLALDTSSNSVDSNRNLDSVSAIYLAMTTSSKLECVDERGQDSLITSVCNMEDEEEDEELDEFDPYLFIKNLPNLSSVVPTFRPVLLPKQTRSCPPISLVLDLDETLVHSTLEPCDEVDFTFPVHFNEEEHTVYVRCRPHLHEFMERVSRLFEIIIFTASQSIYAEQLLNVLDPKRKLFRHRVYRDSCVFFDGNYLKDLSVLGRDLSRVIIVDNSPQAFGFQVENGVPIESWFNDPSDKELLHLLPFLESLIGAEDVRPMIAKKFNLKEKIDAAVASPEYPAEAGDPFER